MPKLPRLSGKELVKILSEIGFRTIRQRGSHIFLLKEKDGEKISTVVPLHNEIDTGTLLEIIRQCRLSREEFFELL